MDSRELLDIIEKRSIRFIDLRFTDTLGMEQHVSIPAKQIASGLLEDGKYFDGSSMKGWQGIEQSDLLLTPDLTNVFLDPFQKEQTLIIRCDVIDPISKQGYSRDPRSIAKRAESYLKESGIADQSLMGPEPEFFIFDDVRWKVDMQSSFYSVDSKEGAWNSDKIEEGGNHAHRPSIQGGYFPVPPVDSSYDLRAEMCECLHAVGIEVEAHHHEVATGNQNEISFKCNTLLRKADEMQMYKYVIRNVARRHNKTVTFMPKPIVGDNGSGMHCHQSLMKNGKNLFVGQGYAGLSELALYYIGGIFKHARALNALTNPTTNSYKRLVPGFEAPVTLTYSARNRSAAIRIPHFTNPYATRIEVRFPDPLANPYLAFSAMLMAGLDGIRRKIHPGDPNESDLYQDTPEHRALPTVCADLEEALEALQKDHAFLLEGSVFTENFIDSYIKLKQEEVAKYKRHTHPVEFEMYYSM